MRARTPTDGMCPIVEMCQLENGASPDEPETIYNLERNETESSEKQPDQESYRRGSSWFLDEIEFLDETEKREIPFFMLRMLRFAWSRHRRDWHGPPKKLFLESKQLEQLLPEKSGDSELPRLLIVSGKLAEPGHSPP